MCVCVRREVHTYIHTYVHTYIHTYIHIHIYIHPHQYVFPWGFLRFFFLVTPSLVTQGQGTIAVFRKGRRHAQVRDDQFARGHKDNKAARPAAARQGGPPDRHGRNGAPVLYKKKIKIT